MSSISDAIARQRPDLNRETRFERTGKVPESPLSQGAYSMPPPYVPDYEFQPGDDLPPAAPRRPGSRVPGLTALFATTRSRWLGLALGCVSLGLLVGYFPSLDAVRGKSRPVPLRMAPMVIAAATQAELNRPVAAPQATPAPLPEAAAPTPPPLTRQRIQLQTQMKPSPSEPVALTPVMSLSVGAVADEPGGARFIPIDQPVDEPLLDLGEVLYEAQPAPSLTASVDAADSGSTRKASRPAGSSTSSSVSSSSASRNTAMTLSGIFWDRENPMAMIDGEIYEVGQQVSGSRIVEIRPEVVVLDRDGVQSTLSL